MKKRKKQAVQAIRRGVRVTASDYIVKAFRYYSENNIPENMGILESKGLLYFTLMGVLAGLCVLGIFTFTKYRGNNYWWRWISF